MMRMAATVMAFSSVFLLFQGNNTVISSATVITLHNNCPFTIWPTSIVPSDSSSSYISTVDQLPSNSTTTLPPSTASDWSGKIWARTGCIAATSKPSCTTGDSPPFTFVEIRLGQQKDSYDVNLVQGYNVGIGVTANGEGCKYAGCIDDMNTRCPAELRVEGPDGETVACKNACQAFGAEQYCCTGKYSSPESCGKTRYSQLFKAACPVAYTYMYDDETNTCTCAAGSDYLITFCPSRPLDAVSKEHKGM